MDEPVEHLYFNWLCAKVLNLRPPSGTDPYWKLLRKLYRTEFVWTMSGDDNRSEDGKELRRDFILQADVPDDPEWRIAIGCSVLEMLIAFAKRAEYQDETPFPDWFWEFITNLGLGEQTDSRFDEEFVEMVLDDFIWRTYNPDGNGGLFPIKNPSADQREIEVWYQFCEYLVDQDRLP
jgi:hypothetical protein